MDQQVLGDKVAIVTGAGNSKGMGWASCLALASLGARVVATDLERDGVQDQLQALCAEIEALGGRARALTLDVTNAKDVDRVVEDVVGTEGRVDILFNNAGLGAGVGPFLEISDQEWQSVWSVNVMGMVSCARAVIPHMQAIGGGVIINNASLAGLGVVEEMSAYSASKFAVIGLTKSLAAEFGKDGIRCNAVCPGSIQTSMYELEIEHVSKSTGRSRQEVEAELDSLVPLGRSAMAREVADVVAFLASPASGYVSGVALPVAGGMAPGL